MPTFDALFLGSFVADVIFCLFVILIQIKLNTRNETSDSAFSIVKTIVAFVFVWIIVAGGAVLLARKCSWESDLFKEFIASRSATKEFVDNIPTNIPEYEDSSITPSNEYVDTTNNMVPSSTPYIEITNVEYSTLRAGASCDIKVTVRYSCPEATQCILMIGFNNAEKGSFRMQSKDYQTSGNGEYTFVTKIVPVIWSDGTPFMVYVNISSWPHDDSWTPYATDDMMLDVTS